MVLCDMSRTISLFYVDASIDCDSSKSSRLILAHLVIDSQAHMPNKSSLLVTFTLDSTYSLRV